MELWAFAESGKPLAAAGRRGRITTLPDGRHLFRELDRPGRRGVSTIVEIRPFRRIFYLVAQGDRVASFHRDVPR